VYVSAAQELAKISRFAFPSNECGALCRQIIGASFGFPGRRICETVAHRSEVPSQITGRGITLLRVFREAALHDPNERNGRLHHFTAEPLGLIAKDCGRRFRMRLLLKRGRSGGHFVEHRPEGKLVRTKI